MTCVSVKQGGQNCVKCTAVAAVPGTPGYTINQTVYGWNASAYSLKSQSGNCYVQFGSPLCIGVVTGFAPARVSSDPRDIPYGFYLYESAGAYWAQVSEAGVGKTTAVRRSATDLYRIERTAGVVSYYINNRLVYRSLVRSEGALRVVSNLYASADTVN